MSRKRGINFATQPDAYEPYEVAARLHMRKWAAEMNRGSGQDNILNWFDQVRDRASGSWPGGPGPGFSAPAERADRALRVVRQMHPPLAVVLMAWALDVSLAPSRTEREARIAHEQLARGFAAFATALHFARSLASAQIQV